jgi:hypothetical protein
MKFVSAFHQFRDMHMRMRSFSLRSRNSLHTFDVLASFVSNHARHSDLDR